MSGWESGEESNRAILGSSGRQPTGNGGNGTYCEWRQRPFITFVFVPLQTTDFLLPADHVLVRETECSNGGMKPGRWERRWSKSGPRSRRKYGCVRDIGWFSCCFILFFFFLRPKKIIHKTFTCILVYTVFLFFIFRFGIFHSFSFFFLSVFQVDI